MKLRNNIHHIIEGRYIDGSPPTIVDINLMRATQSSRRELPSVATNASTVGIASPAFVAPTGRPRPSGSDDVDFGFLGAAAFEYFFVFLPLAPAAAFFFDSFLNVADFGAALADGFVFFVFFANDLDDDLDDDFDDDFDDDLAVFFVDAAFADALAAAAAAAIAAAAAFLLVDAVVVDIACVLRMEDVKVSLFV